MYIPNIIFLIGLELMLFGHAASIDATAFLRLYGYMEDSSALGDISSDSTSDHLQEPILRFQKFVGLPQTGRLDESTLRKMESPRCGNADMKITTSRRRQKRFKLTKGEKWDKNTLTYKVVQYSKNISPNEIDITLSLAFQYWSTVTNLDFVRKAPDYGGAVDIKVRFATYDHGDEEAFDGPGKIIAHAFYPVVGQVHFDDSEDWAAINEYGSGHKFLLPVAVHEIGHSLGLNHSSAPYAVMAPFYRDYQPGTFRLDADDVNGIQALYGPKSRPRINENPTWTTLLPAEAATQPPCSSHNSAGYGCASRRSTDYFNVLPGGYPANHLPTRPTFRPSIGRDPTRGPSGIPTRSHQAGSGWNTIFRYFPQTTEGYRISKQTTLLPVAGTRGYTQWRGDQSTEGYRRSTRGPGVFPRRTTLLPATGVPGSRPWERPTARPTRGYRRDRPTTLRGIFSGRFH